MNIAVTIGTLLLLMNQAGAQRQMEKLGRGMIAINQGDGKVYVGWRMLGTDPENIAFNVYRNNICVNSKPITKSHDPIYRLSVAWQNVACNQPAQPGFYMGDGMAAPPRPSITTPAH